MSFAVTTEERCVLQFFFGVLNRVLAEPSLRDLPMMQHYAATITDVWHMEDGTQTVAALADVHARAVGAYEMYVRVPHGAVLASLREEEQGVTFSPKQQRSATELAPVQDPASVFYEAFFTFFAMSLALLLGPTLGAEDVRLLHARLLPSADARKTFERLAAQQCAAMDVTPAAMAGVLAASLDPAARPRDAHKVAIVTCVNDEALYAESRARLSKLALPDGWSLDFVPVRRAPSMCAGYAAGMAATDAQYKLYLHQDMMLERRELLLTILPFFQQHPEVGLIGLAGCRRWHANGIWWEDEDAYLHLAHGGGAARHALAVGTMADAWQRMAMLDGVFLMTQADVPWRADLLRGWHFYDIAACAEFRRAGYEIAIPRQDTPWFTHLAGDRDVDMVYHYWRAVFLDAYGKDIVAWRRASI